MSYFRYHIRYTPEGRQGTGAEKIFDSKSELLQFIDTVLSANYSKSGGCLEITMENVPSAALNDETIHEKCKECVSYPKACSGIETISTRVLECFYPKPR